MKKQEIVWVVLYEHNFTTRDGDYVEDEYMEQFEEFEEMKKFVKDNLNKVIAIEKTERDDTMLTIIERYYNILDFI